MQSFGFYSKFCNWIEVILKSAKLSIFLYMVKLRVSFLVRERQRTIVFGALAKVTRWIVPHTIKQAYPGITQILHDAIILQFESQHHFIWKLSTNGTPTFRFDSWLTFTFMNN
ncbi:unnamed protein product [Vicia faba]|uniref:Uncharacterized protein n=1 Tax=Vicia faba TaxID=3906 RepID=A0AAV1B056_VICFA|nr:unnamed protein product [Vicia faba]